MRATGIVAAVAASALLAGGAWAGSWPGICVDLDAIIEGVLRAVPGSSVELRLSGEDAVRFMVGFNALPPPSGYSADEVVVFVRADAPWRYVIVLDGGCVEAIAELSPAAVRMIAGNGI